MAGTIVYGTVANTNIKYVEDTSGTSVAIAIDYTGYMANIVSLLTSIDNSLKTISNLSTGDGIHTRSTMGWTGGVSHIQTSILTTTSNNSYSTTNTNMIMTGI